jgi:ABC-2 type transport system permease protein
MAAIAALARKDIRLMLRDRTGFFFTFFFPLIMALFFGVMFSGGGSGGSGNAKLKIAVVDEDRTAGSAAFVERLRGATDLDVIDAATREEAFDMVRRNAQDRTAYVVLPPGFGAAREQFFSGRTTTILLGVDPSRKAEAGMLEGVMTRYAFEQLQNAMSDPPTMREQVRRSLAAIESDSTMSSDARERLRTFLASADTFSAGLSATTDSEADSAADTTATGAGWQPVRIEKSEVQIEERGPRSAFAISFPQGIIWALIGCSMSFVLSIVGERLRGTLVRLRVAPISRWHILAGKSLACFLTAAGVTFVLLLIMTALGVRPTSPALLVLAVAASAVCFVGLMMLFAAICRTESAASGMGWAAMLVMAMLGGGMVPLFVMPTWMQSVSVVSPVRWTVLAFEGAIWRGYSLVEMLVPCGILVAVGAAAFMIGTAAFRASHEG